MNYLERKEDAKFEERPRSQRDKIPIDEGKPKMGQFDSRVSSVRQGQAEDWKGGFEPSRTSNASGCSFVITGHSEGRALRIA
jgi:hypothetical protein